MTTLNTTTTTQEEASMKKIFVGIRGKFYGMATKVEQTGKNVTVTMPGDFPGMLERTEIFESAKILHEDEKRVYIAYK